MFRAKQPKATAHGVRLLRCLLGRYFGDVIRIIE